MPEFSELGEEIVLNIKNLYKMPQHFLKLTGLTSAKFEKICQEFEPIFKEAEQKRKDNPDRKRRKGAGPKPKLTAEQALFMYCFQSHNQYSYSLVGFFMSIDATNVGRYLKKIKPLLAEITLISDMKNYELPPIKTIISKTK